MLEMFGSINYCAIFLKYFADEASISVVVGNLKASIVVCEGSAGRFGGAAACEEAS